MDANSTVTVRVKPDARAWIAAGYAPADYVTVDLADAAAEARELIASHLSIEGTEYVLRCRGVLVTVSEPTLDGLLAGISAAESAAAERAAIEEARRAEEVARTRERLVADARANAWYRGRRGPYAVASVPAKLRDDPEVQAAVRQAEKAVAAAKAEVDRQIEEREAEEAARRAAEKAEREEWIAAHGSRRLRRLAAEGIEHDAVYRDERLALERPAWQWSQLGDGEHLPGREPRNAPEAALDLLDAARQDDPGAELRYLDSRRHVPHYEDTPDVDRDDCPLCDDDGDHTVGHAEYRCYARFLGRLIVTREAVKVEQRAETPALAGVPHESAVRG